MIKTFPGRVGNCFRKLFPRKSGGGMWSFASTNLFLFGKKTHSHTGTGKTVRFAQKKNGIPKIDMTSSSVNHLKNQPKRSKNYSGGSSIILRCCTVNGKEILHHLGLMIISMISGGFYHHSRWLGMRFLEPSRVGWDTTNFHQKIHHLWSLEGQSNDPQRSF